MRVTPVLCALRLSGRLRRARRHRRRPLRKKLLRWPSTPTPTEEAADAVPMAPMPMAPMSTPEPTAPRSAASCHALCGGGVGRRLLFEGPVSMRPQASYARTSPPRYRAVEPSSDSNVILRRARPGLGVVFLRRGANSGEANLVQDLTPGGGSEIWSTWCGPLMRD